MYSSLQPYTTVVQQCTILYNSAQYCTIVYNSVQLWRDRQENQSLRF